MTQCGLCKDCRWWKRGSVQTPTASHGECVAWFEARDSMFYPKEILHSEDVEIDYDEMGFHSVIQTHAYFGCIQFEPKTENDGIS